MQVIIDEREYRELMAIKQALDLVKAKITVGRIKAENMGMGYIKRDFNIYNETEIMSVLKAKIDCDEKRYDELLDKYNKLEQCKKDKKPFWL